MKTQYFKIFANYLKGIRESKEVSLTDMAKFTKLKLENLRRIENGDFEFLPIVYIQSYLRQYATALNINPDKLIGEFNTLLQKIAFLEDDAGLDRDYFLFEEKLSSDLKKHESASIDQFRKLWQDFTSDAQISIDEYLFDNLSIEIPQLEEKFQEKLKINRNIKIAVLSFSYLLVITSVFWIAKSYNDDFGFGTLRQSPEGGVKAMQSTEQRWVLSKPLFVKSYLKQTKPESYNRPQHQFAYAGNKISIYSAAVDLANKIRGRGIDLRIKARAPSGIKVKVDNSAWKYYILRRDELIDLFAEHQFQILINSFSTVALMVNETRLDPKSLKILAGQPFVLNYDRDDPKRFRLSL